MNIISLSLWGTDELYLRGAVANARLVHTVYPGWTMRVYCSAEVSVIDELRERGADVRVAPTGSGHAGLFWRFLPAAEQDLAYVIFRDADSRLSVRERYAVDAWMASGLPFHAMRDHIHHRHTPMLGGMWGCRGGAIADMPDRLARFAAHAKKHDDTRFLRTDIWPSVMDRCLVHSSVPRPLGGEPFPEHPATAGFVGRIVPPRVESAAVIAVLVPSRGRPHAALATLHGARATASNPSLLRIAVGIEPDDEISYRSAFGEDASSIHVLKAGGNYVRAIRELQRSIGAGIYGLAADDFRFETNGWDDRIRDTVADLPRRIGVVYGDDGLQHERLATLPFVTPEWIANVGDVLPGGYAHLFCDTELTDIARQAGLLHFLADVKIAHRHYTTGQTPWDETYERSSTTCAAGETEFDRRREERRRLARRAARSAGTLASLTRLPLPSAVDRLLLIASCRHDETAVRAWAEWVTVSGLDRATPGSQDLFPLAWRNLQRLGAAGAAFDALKRVYWTSWGAAQAQASTVAAAAKALRGERIPVMVVGGVAIGSQYYDEPALRPTGTVVLMVFPHFEDRARQLLETRALPSAYRVVTRAVDRRASGLSGDDDAARVWARAEDAEIGGEPVQVLSPADELLRLVVRGVQRRQVAVLQWPADLFAVIDAAKDRFNWSVLAEEARRGHVTARLRIALNYARATFEHPSIERACGQFAAANVPTV